MNFLVRFISLIGLIMISTPAFAELKCEHIGPITELMLKQHLVHTKFSSNIEARTIEQFIKLMDTGKLYFLESDVKQITSMMTGNTQKKIATTNCKLLEDVNEIIRKRVSERIAFGEKYLKPEMKFNPQTKINLDSDKRKFPKTTKEADEYQEKYIQWQLATFLASDMKQDEARQQILRRYQRAQKTMAEQKPEERMSLYLTAVARALDPHSAFMSKEETEDFNIQMGLSLEGIGATLSSQDGYTVIEQLVPGGAAANSSMVQAQDKIIAVGQGDDGPLESVIDMPLKDVVRLIRGAKGTKVRLNILRKTSEGTQTSAVVLTRQKINLEQDAAQISYIEKVIKGTEKSTLGVINLPSFYLDTSRGGRSCYEDVKKLLAEAKQKKVSGIVLDLSQNGGGSLEDAVKLTGLFFAKGNVVKTRGRETSARQLKTSIFSRGHADDNTDVLADEDENTNYAGPLVVLTSRLSASASEILSGALRDYKRAVIVGGDHTFGKGSVQQVVRLPENLGSFKVTVGMFFTPGGNSTQHRGVPGDVVLPGPFSTEEIGEKSLDYSLPPQSISPFISQSAYVKTGESTWQPVNDDTLKKLKKDSHARVSKNDEFKKILKESEELQSKNKTVFLAEIVKKKDETVKKEEKRKKEAADPGLKKEEYLKRPDIQESVNVLIDLISVQGPPRLASSEAK